MGLALDTNKEGRTPTLDSHLTRRLKCTVHHRSRGVSPIRKIEIECVPRFAAAMATRDVIYLPRVAGQALALVHSRSVQTRQSTRMNEISSSLDLDRGPQEPLETVALDLPRGNTNKDRRRASINRGPLKALPIKANRQDLLRAVYLKGRRRALVQTACRPSSTWVSLRHHLSEKGNGTEEAIVTVSEKGFQQPQPGAMKPPMQQKPAIQQQPASKPTIQPGANYSREIPPGPQQAYGPSLQPPQATARGFSPVSDEDDNEVAHKPPPSRAPRFQPTKAAAPQKSAIKKPGGGGPAKNRVSVRASVQFITPPRKNMGVKLSEEPIGNALHKNQVKMAAASAQDEEPEKPLVLPIEDIGYDDIYGFLDDDNDTNFVDETVYVDTAAPPSSTPLVPGGTPGGLRVSMLKGASGGRRGSTSSARSSFMSKPGGASVRLSVSSKRSSQARNRGSFASAVSGASSSAHRVSIMSIGGKNAANRASFRRLSQSVGGKRKSKTPAVPTMFVVADDGEEEEVVVEEADDDWWFDDIVDAVVESSKDEEPTNFGGQPTSPFISTQDPGVRASPKVSPRASRSPEVTSPKSPRNAIAVATGIVNSPTPTGPFSPRRTDGPAQAFPDKRLSFATGANLMRSVSLNDRRQAPAIARSASTSSRTSNTSAGSNATNNTNTTNATNKLDALMEMFDGNESGSDSENPLQSQFSSSSPPAPSSLSIRTYTSSEASRGSTGTRTPTSASTRISARSSGGSTIRDSQLARDLPADDGEDFEARRLREREVRRQSRIRKSVELSAEYGAAIADLASKPNGASSSVTDSVSPSLLEVVQLPAISLDDGLDFDFDFYARESMPPAPPGVAEKRLSQLAARASRDISSKDSKRTSRVEQIRLSLLKEARSAGSSKRSSVVRPSSVDFRNLQAEVESLRSALETSQQELGPLRSTLSEKDRALAEAKAQLAEAEASARSAAGNGQRETAVRAMLQKKVEELEGSVQNAEEERASVLRQMQALDAQRLELEDSLENAAREQEAAEEELDEIVAERDAALHDAETKSRALAGAQAAVAAAAGELEMIRTRELQTRARAEDAERRLQELEQSLSAAEQRAAHAQRSAGEAASAEAEQRARELDDVRRELEVALGETEVKGEELDAMRESASKLNGRVKMLKAELEDSRRSAEASEARVKELEEHLYNENAKDRNLGEQIDFMRRTHTEEVRRLQTAAESLQNDVRIAFEEKEMWEQRVVELEKALGDLEKERDGWRARSNEVQQYLDSHISDSEAKIASLEKALSDSAGDTGSRFEQLEGELNSARAEIQKRDERIVEFEMALERARAQVEEAEEQVRSATAAKEDLEDRVAALEDQIARAEDEKLRAVAVIEQLRRGLAEAERERKAIQDAMMELQGNFEDVSADREELENRIATLEDELAQARSSFVGESQAREEELSRAYEDVRAEMQRLQADADEQLARARAESEGLRRELDARGPPEQHERSVSAGLDQHSESGDAQLEAARRELQQAQEAAAYVHEATAAAEMQLREVEAARDALAEECEQYRDMLDQKDQELRDVCEEADELRGQLEQASSVANSQAEMIRRLESVSHQQDRSTDGSEMASELETARLEMDELRSRLNEMVESSQQQHNYMLDLESQLDGMSAALHNEERNAAETAEALQRAEADLSSIQAKLEEATQVEAELRLKLSQQEESMSSKRYSLASSFNDSSELVSALQSEIDNIQADLDLKTQEYSKLEGELGQAQQTIQELRRELFHAGQETDELRQRLDESSLRIEELSRQNGTSNIDEEEIQRLREENENAAYRAEDLERELEHAREEASRFEEERRALEDELFRRSEEYEAALADANRAAQDAAAAAATAAAAAAAAQAPQFDPASPTTPTAAEDSSAPSQRSEAEFAMEERLRQVEEESRMRTEGLIRQLQEQEEDTREMRETLVSRLRTQEGEVVELRAALDTLRNEKEAEAGRARQLADALERQEEAARDAAAMSSERTEAIDRAFQAAQEEISLLRAQLAAATRRLEAAAARGGGDGASPDADYAGPSLENSSGRGSFSEIIDGPSPPPPQLLFPHAVGPAGADLPPLPAADAKKPQQ
ncbi:hypothetical protein HK405_002983, partial [Cladochytrium tenue]